MEVSSPSVPPLKGLLSKVLIAVALTAVTFAGLSLYGDVEKVSAELRDFEYSYLYVALALSLGNYLIRALRWQYYLRHAKVKVPHWEGILVFLAGLVMTITPGKMGEVFKGFLLKWTRGAPLAEVTAVVVAERVADLLAMVLLAAWGALIIPEGKLIAALLLVLGVTLILLVTWRGLGLFALRMLGRLPIPQQKLERARDAYTSLVSMFEAGPLVIGIALGVFAWWLQVVAVSQLALGLPGGALGLQQAAFAYCSPMLAGVLALLPGGIGVTEAGMAHLLQAHGTWSTEASAVTVTILARVATLWWAVIVGAVCIAIHRQLTGWQRQP